MTRRTGEKKTKKAKEVIESKTGNIEKDSTTNKSVESKKRSRSVSPVTSPKVTGSG